MGLAPETFSPNSQPTEFTLQNKLKRLAAISLVSVLAACGGGGGGGRNHDADIEGGYAATSNDGSSGSVLVLEDRTAWSIVGTESGGLLVVEALYRGPLSVSGSDVTSSTLRRYTFDTGDTLTGVGFSGKVGSSGVITSTLTATGFDPVNTVLTPIDPAVYDYRRPATLAAIAGTWSGFFSTGDDGSVVISSGGVVSSVTSVGCTISGTVVPRASGKNVYDVTVNFGPAPCALPNGTGIGVAIIASPPASARQLTVAVVNADLSLGAAFFGSALP